MILLFLLTFLFWKMGWNVLPLAIIYIGASVIGVGYTVWWNRHNEGVVYEEEDDNED